MKKTNNKSLKDELIMEEGTMEVMDLKEDEAFNVKDVDEEGYYTDNTMKQYTHDIAKIPLLTAEEEIYIGRIIKEGSAQERKEAIDHLVKSNLRLVVHYAKNYLGSGVEFEDLNAMGIEGLIRAAEKFDYTKGYKFSTYATWWIKQTIMRGIADEGRMMRIPVHMGETMNKVRRAQKELFQEMGQEPTVEEIAIRSGFSEETVLTAFRSMSTVVSFDLKVGDDGDSTLEDFLPDENAVNPEESVEVDALTEAIQDVLGQLEPREAMVLSFRYGIGVNRCMTLDEIAKLPEFGVTRERIRQIESKAMRKIRNSKSMRNMLRDFAA